MILEKTQEIVSFFVTLCIKFKIKMALILNIETATKNCSVALSKAGITLAIREIAEQNFSHAEKLHIFIEELLLETNIALKEVKAIAVSQGPGSYTGLRIGVSAAKGLCYALSIPLIAVDTLEILARKIMRARDYIRSHRRELFHKNEFLAQKAINIFFDAYVTVYINSLETLHNVNDWPKHLLEQIAKSLYRALLPIDNYSDPFRLISDSF